MKEFVFPTVDSLNDGCGVLVGNLFITAAHVVQDHDFMLFIERKTLCLNKKEAMIFNYNQSESGADVAIFRLDGYKSPLELDMELPEKGMILDSVCFEHVVEGKSNDWSHYGNHTYYDSLPDEVLKNFKGFVIGFKAFLDKVKTTQKAFPKDNMPDSE